MKPPRFARYVPTLACVAALAACASLHAAAPAAPRAPTADFGQAWPDYRQRQSRLPLRYEAIERVRLDGAERRSYRLYSQSWPESGGADPAQWSHRVDLYVPDAARPKSALLVINNGTNRGNGSDPQRPPSDFSEELARETAVATQTIVVSVSDAPNQYLALPGEPPRKEDALVAATWRRFLDEPVAANATLPLHVPMAEAAVKAMDLAQRELAPYRLRSFVVTGASKRAWAAWLTAIGDARVGAIVSYVIDMRIAPLIGHIGRVYGGGWPIALQPYYQEGITRRYQEPAFARLMQVDDPYSYLSGRHRARLGIPKYLVSASGDDFFPPDAQRLYVDDLPGATALRAAPNSNHGGIRDHIRTTLIPALQRWNRHQALPQVRARLGERDGALRLSARASERPVSARLWLAENPDSRDFRYACGVRYREQPLELRRNAVEAALAKPARGWGAAFVEFAFADGFVATSPVFVYPDAQFPNQPPPNGSGACLVLPPHAPTHAPAAAPAAANG
ncbi:PhoPQ-activated pathogenicity-related family protein [Lysobacter enzymogenes]|uniref:PhoPQ-activated pathogenicity-related family protein n=1 Tax=Lysobacter enzymogenes TaxID=69 RepID=UPI00099DEABE|nr:PhoPQ-activated protein PqaA family protein [Lysobacter enzymogenes]UZW58864.1 PhoPQ-activated protein PqaA family protein [Lysobacter enzymogenes]